MRLEHRYHKLASQPTEASTVVSTTSVREGADYLLQQVRVAVRKTEYKTTDAVDVWRHVQMICRQEKIDFCDILGLEIGSHGSVLERVVFSRNAQCCLLFHALLQNGSYIEGRILRTDTLLVTKMDQEGRSHGLRMLPRNGYYIGDFRHGRLHGTGKSDTNFGFTYEGSFQNDKYHGPGAVISKYDAKEDCRGLFIDGRFVGDPNKAPKKELKNWFFGRIQRPFLN